MATVAGPNVLKEGKPDLLSGTPRAHALDRWIFVVQAVFFLVLVLAGFIPDAIGMVAAANAGLRPPLPIILHVHAVVMGSFLLLLLSQSVLMATGRCELHKRVGIAAFVLVPVLVVVGLMLAPTIYREFWSFAQTAPPEVQEKLQFRIRMLDDILLMQIRIGDPVPAVHGHRIGGAERECRTAQAHDLPGDCDADASGDRSDALAAEHDSGERHRDRPIHPGVGRAAVHLGRGAQSASARGLLDLARH